MPAASFVPLLPAPPDAPWELLAQRLAGETTPAAEAALRAWVAAHPENLGLLLQVSRTWEQAALGSVAGLAPGAAGLAENVSAAGALVGFSPSPAHLEAAWQRFETTVMGPVAPPQGSSGGSAGGAPAGAGSGVGTGAGSGAAATAGAGALAMLGKAAALLVAGAGLGWGLRGAVSEEAPTGRVTPVAATQRVPDHPAAGNRAGQDETGGPSGTLAGARPGAPLAPADSLRPGQSAELVFDNTPVSEVVSRLERTFVATHILVADPALARCRFTGSFSPARPAAVLRVLSIATNATLLHHPNGTWELRGAGCP